MWKVLERSLLSPSILGLVWKGTTGGSSELHRLTDEASAMTVTLVTYKQMSWRVGAVCLLEAAPLPSSEGQPTDMEVTHEAERPTAHPEWSPTAEPLGQPPALGTGPKDW